MNGIIFGNGWLGNPLKNELLKSGFNVVSTHRSESVSDDLIQFPSNFFRPPFETIDFAVIAFTPNRSDFYAYAQDCIDAVNSIDENAHIILISSTSVFKDGDYTVDENNIVELDENSSILNAELLLLKFFKNRLSIIRMSGLIGPNRYPVTAMAKTGKVYDGASPVNLIHLEDAIGLIKTVITASDKPKVIHGVTPHHPTKNEFYTWLGQKIGTEIPVFDNSLPKNKAIESYFNSFYSYKYTSLFDIL